MISYILEINRNNFLSVFIFLIFIIIIIFFNVWILKLEKLRYCVEFNDNGQRLTQRLH